MKNDPYIDAMCSRTAATYTKLCGLRGVSASIEWKGGQYVANGTPCGPSVHGLERWLNSQPGVLP